MIARMKMIKSRAVLIAILSSCGGCASLADHSEIPFVLAAQAKAWNDADIEAFMEHYWKSDELTFSTPDAEVKGWQATLDRYRRRYPTPEAMGKLRFEDLVIGRAEKGAATVSGRYHLTRQAGPASGRFTLQMRRIEGRWVIVRDHTIADE